MTYDEMKTWLNRAYLIESIIRSDNERIEELNILRTTIGSFDYSKPNVQTSKDGDGIFTRRTNELIDIKREYEQRLFNQLQTKLEIRAKIELLEDNTEKLVLIYRHLDFYDWNTIKEKMHYSRPQVFRIYRNAINNLCEKDETK